MDLTKFKEMKKRQLALESSVSKTTFYGILVPEDVSCGRGRDK